MHSDHNTEKKEWKIQKLPEKVQDKVKIREKDAAIEPDGQKNTLTWRRPYVTYGKNGFQSL